MSALWPLLGCWHRVLTGENAFLAAEIATDIDSRLVVCASPDRVGIRFRHAVRCIHFSCTRKQRRFCPTVGRQLDQLVDLKTRVTATRKSSARWRPVHARRISASDLCFPLLRAAGKPPPGRGLPRRGFPGFRRTASLRVARSRGPSPKARADPEREDRCPRGTAPRPGSIRTIGSPRPLSGREKSSAPRDCGRRPWPGTQAVRTSSSAAISPPTLRS